MASASAHQYKNHLFSPEIISHAVWLYHRFSLSFRDVEELLDERGIIVSYEAVRSGVSSSGLRSPSSFGIAGDDRETRGISTNCLSGSVVHDITCGGRWIEMRRCSVFSCRNGSIHTSLLLPTDRWGLLQAGSVCPTFADAYVGKGRPSKNHMAQTIPTWTVHPMRQTPTARPVLS